MEQPGLMIPCHDQGKPCWVGYQVVIVLAMRSIPGNARIEVTKKRVTKVSAGSLGD